MAHRFSARLNDLGDGNFAYIQPHGEWGLSNAGLIIDGGKSILIDTLFDLARTQQMLDMIKDQTGINNKFDYLFNTHDNGDHCFGNQLVNAEHRVCSAACARFMKNDRAEQLSNALKKAPSMGELGRYYLECFGSFDFEGIDVPLPTEVFQKSMNIQLESKIIELINLGPAHTDGDTIAIDHKNKTVFTGDLVFHDVTPILWAGPVSGWLKACDHILQLAPDIVVPGHGPIGNVESVKKVKSYLSYVFKEAQLRHSAGMSVLDAAVDISLNEFRSWYDSERIAANVHAIYRELNHDLSEPNKFEIFELMARVKKQI